MADDRAILIPFFGMMLLTLIVLTYMAVRRLGYSIANRMNPQAFATPESVARMLPEAVNHSSNNLKNLFELPVLFYAICLYQFVTGSVDAVHVFCAYAFVGFRALHSAIHCTINRVMLRFTAYTVAATFLVVMVIRSAVQALHTPA